MKFWKWFFGGIPHLPRALIKGLLSPTGEYLMAMLLGVILGVIVIETFSRWWLLLVVPAFCLMASHGYWRSWVKNK